MNRIPVAAVALPAALALACVALPPTVANAQSGSYQQSCRAISTGGGKLSAECKASNGQYRSSSIDASRCHGDIGNQNGLLACNGATAQGGSFVSENRSGGRNDNGRGDDNNRGNNSNRGYDNNRGYDSHRGNDGGYSNRGYDSNRGYNGYNRPAPPPPPSTGAGLILYDGVNFTGHAFAIGGNLHDLDERRFDNVARSARVRFGTWRLCANPNFQACRTVDRDVYDLHSIGLRANISSVARDR